MFHDILLHQNQFGLSAGSVVDFQAGKVDATAQAVTRLVGAIPLSLMSGIICHLQGCDFLTFAAVNYYCGILLAGSKRQFKADGCRRIKGIGIITDGGLLRRRHICVCQTEG